MKGFIFLLVVSFLGLGFVQPAFSGVRVLDFSYSENCNPTINVFSDNAQVGAKDKISFITVLLDETGSMRGKEKNVVKMVNDFFKNDSTPLYDSIAKTINRHSYLSCGLDNALNILIIISDGVENASADTENLARLHLGFSDEDIAVFPAADVNMLYVDYEKED